MTSLPAYYIKPERLDPFNFKSILKGSFHSFLSVDMAPSYALYYIY